MNLDPADAAELADLLQFIVGWLASDREHIASSLLHYAGDVPYGLGQLHLHLDRFTALLREDNDMAQTALEGRLVECSAHPAHSISRSGSTIGPLAARATSSDRLTRTPRMVAWVTPEPRTASRWFTSERSDGYTSEACRGPCPGWKAKA